LTVLSKMFLSLTCNGLALATIATGLLAGCTIASLSKEKKYQREVIVNAASIWQHTFIYCIEGDTLLMSADTGSWQEGETSVEKGAAVIRPVDANGDSAIKSPDNYLLPGAPKGCLIARLGQNIFFVGKNCRHEVSKTEQGELRLSSNSTANASGDANHFTINTGSIPVRITVIRSSSHPESPLKP
jgi:hypothetical protein